MARIEWDESLSIGIPLIDNQHKTWIEHIAALAKAIEGRVGLGQVVQTLDFLIDYTAFHFRTEEEQMASAGYPGLEEHRQRHQALTATVKTLLRDYEEDGATHALVDDVAGFLRNWLVKHIREVDTQFAAFVKEKGIVVAGA
jgi:hemerythrin